MKNALNAYRKEKGLTYRQLTAECGGRSLYSVYRHCQLECIPAESAIIYSRSLGIPLSELRPDLWPPGLITLPTTQLTGDLKEKGEEDAA